MFPDNFRPGWTQLAAQSRSQFHLELAPKQKQLFSLRYLRPCNRNCSKWNVLVAFLSNGGGNTDTKISLYKPNATVSGRNCKSRLPCAKYQSLSFLALNQLNSTSFEIFRRVRFRNPSFFCDMTPYHKASCSRRFEKKYHSHLQGFRGQIRTSEPSQ